MLGGAKVLFIIVRNVQFKNNKKPFDTLTRGVDCHIGHKQKTK